MDKAIASFFLFLILAVFGGLGYHLLTNEDSVMRLQERFERQSQFSSSDVYKCLLSTSGARVFSGFEELSVLGASHIEDMGPYIAKDGSRLDIIPKDEGTLVRFSSGRVAHADELELLNWCAEKPDQIWIRKVSRKSARETTTQPSSLPHPLPHPDRSSAASGFG